MNKVSKRSYPNEVTYRDAEVVIIKLNHDRQAVVDAADYELISQYRWYARRARHSWYASSGTLWKQQPKVHMHRVILGLTDPSLLVDHKDSDGLNNRRSNLRIATTGQNAVNAKLSRANRSGYKGVRFSFGSWRAHVVINGKARLAGNYPTAEEAARAYDIKAKELFGEFARLNFPEGEHTND